MKVEGGYPFALYSSCYLSATCCTIFYYSGGIIMKRTRITNLRPILAIILAAMLLLTFTSCAAKDDVPDAADPNAVQFTFKVSHRGDQRYSDQITGAVGEQIPCQIVFTNLNPEPQTDIIIWAELPPQLLLLEDTAYYYDAEILDGVKIKNDITQGIQIDECAGYDPETGAHEGETITIKFTAQIVSTDTGVDELFTTVTGGLKTPTGVYKTSANLTITPG